jgi:hypothetical protein
MPDPEAAKTRASAIALISIAFLGVLLFLLSALVSALAPAYAGLSGGSLPSVVLAALGAILFGLSILGALFLVLLGNKSHRD